MSEHELVAGIAAVMVLATTILAVAGIVTPDIRAG
jgi:hypothetical protein